MKNKLFTVMVIGIATWSALFIGGQLPLLGTSISAILIGALIRHTPLYASLDKTITKFISAYLLKMGIVLLGFTLSLRLMQEVGPQILVIIAAVIAVSLLTSFLASKVLRVKHPLSILIGIGTSICGGSAIVATAPIIEAEDEDIAISVTTMFIFSMLALLILPVVGTLLGFDDQLYGILAGVAVNDVASVVATAFDWSDAAGSIATVVKLVRTLMIVPVTIGAIYYKYSQQTRHAKANGTGKVAISWQRIKNIIPMFVVFFLTAVIFASVVPLSPALTTVISRTSKLLMTTALVSIGLGVHIKQIRKAGIKPVILGGVTWLAVVTVSVILISFFYA